MTITDFMAAEHRGCDQLFADAEQAVADGDWTTARATGASFVDSMSRHFRMEEEALFPAFEEATGMVGGPPEMMRIEHQQMRALLDELSQALAAAERDGYLGAAETLLVMMQQHNMKEENILYPMADRAVGGGASVIEQMQQIKAAA